MEGTRDLIRQHGELHRREGFPTEGEEEAPPGESLVQGVKISATGAGAKELKRERSSSVEILEEKVSTKKLKKKKGRRQQRERSYRQKSKKARKSKSRSRRSSEDRRPTRQGGGQRGSGARSRSRSRSQSSPRDFSTYPTRARDPGPERKKIFKIC